MTTSAPINANTPITQDEGGRAVGYVTTYFRQWLLSITNSVDAATKILGRISLTAQQASLAATTVLTTPSAGLYRVTFYVRITQAASVSSSLTVAIGWLEGGLALSQSQGAVTGNTTATLQTISMLVPADANSNLTIQTTYASVGGTPMQYRIEVVAEKVT